MEFKKIALAIVIIAMAVAVFAQSGGLWVRPNGANYTIFNGLSTNCNGTSCDLTKGTLDSHVSWTNRSNSFKHPQVIDSSSDYGLVIDVPIQALYTHGIAVNISGSEAFTIGAILGIPSTIFPALGSYAISSADFTNLLLLDDSKDLISIISGTTTINNFRNFTNNGKVKVIDNVGIQDTKGHEAAYWTNGNFFLPFKMINQTANRKLNTLYTNTKNVSIFVDITIRSTSSFTNRAWAELRMNSSNILLAKAGINPEPTASGKASLFFQLNGIIGPGSTYRLNDNVSAGSNVTIIKWWEAET